VETVTTETIPPRAQRLVRRYYTYAGIYTLAASVVWGINTLFLLQAGLSLAQAFAANAAFSVGTLLFEIPTGVVADTLGRRVSFLASVVVLATTTLLYVWLAEIGAGVVAFSVVSVLMGLGFTFYSGAMEAWLVDGLRFDGYDGGLDPIFGRALFIGNAAMLVGTHDIGFEPRHVRLHDVPREATEVARTGIRFGWGNKSLRLLMIAGAFQSGFFFWAWYAWQPYFLELLERDAVWVAGVVAALLAASLMLGNSIVQIVTRWCGRRTTLMLWTGTVFSIAMIGVGLASTFIVALVLLFLAGVAMGVQMPVRQAYFHEVVPSDRRATVVSFDSMVSGVGGVAGQVGLGALADRDGYSAGYIVGGAATLLSIPLVALVRRYNDAADFFAGTRSGAEPSCVPQGLPALTVVEGTTPSEVA
jgi:MFS family permease